MDPGLFAFESRLFCRVQLSFERAVPRPQILQRFFERLRGGVLLRELLFDFAVI